MSRLDSFIRRMCAQRDILNGLVDRLPQGPILEFGLGSGRTYDHLREIFPGRRIVVFENVVCSWVPRPEHFVVGDIRDTAATLPDGSAALVHADIETGAAVSDIELQGWLPPLIARLLVAGGYAVSGSALPHPALLPCRLPEAVAPDRYHLARKTGAPEGT